MKKQTNGEQRKKEKVKKKETNNKKEGKETKQCCTTFRLQLSNRKCNQAKYKQKLLVRILVADCHFMQRIVILVQKPNNKST